MQLGEIEALEHKEHDPRVHFHLSPYSHPAAHTQPFLVFLAQWMGLESFPVIKRAHSIIKTTTTTTTHFFFFFFNLVFWTTSGCALV